MKKFVTILNTVFIYTVLLKSHHILLSQEFFNKGSLPCEFIYFIVASRIKVFLLLSNEVPPKVKTLLNLESLCFKTDMSIFSIEFRRANGSSEYSGESNEN